jgi:hypothetical protein
VNDKSDIGLVDPHAEGIGGDQDLPLPVQPFALHLGSQIGVEAGMVDSGAFPERRQGCIGHLEYLLTLLARGDIN